MGLGLPTAAVSTHSEHPSGGAHLVRNHHGTRYSTLGFPKKKLGFFFWQKIFFGAPKTAMKTLGGREVWRFGAGGSEIWTGRL